MFRWFKNGPRRPKKHEPLQTHPQGVEVLGRRYLQGEYLLPKDAQEGDRLTFQHHYFHELLQGNFIAPLDPARVRDLLDVGSGSGIWAREMAQQFPAAQVFGLDRECTQILNLPPPPNYRFVRGNVLEGLPFDNHSFDYVHQRLLVAGIPARKWRAEIGELARVTRPGGWVELVEFAHFFHRYGPLTRQLRKWWNQLCEQRGFDMAIIPVLDHFLREAGLHTQKKVVQVPIGGWGGRGGEMLAKDLLAALEAMSGVYCTTLNLPSARFEEVLTGLSGEWDAFQTEFQIFLFLGEKSL